MSPDSLTSGGTRLAEILSAMLHSALTWEEEVGTSKSFDGDQGEPLTGTSSRINCESHRGRIPLRILIGGTANDDRDYDEKCP